MKINNEKINVRRANFQESPCSYSDKRKGLFLLGQKVKYMIKVSEI